LSEIEYHFRPSLLAKERSYRLDRDGISPSDREKLRFSDIRKIRIYDSPGMRNLSGTTLSPGFRRCVIRPAHGRAIVLSSNHFAGIANFEDRRESFDPFVAALMQRVSAANPSAICISGMPIALWLLWLVAVAGVMIVTPLAALLIVIEMIQDGKIDGMLIVVTFLLAGTFFGFIPLARTLWRALPRRFDPRDYSTAT
jgi:hypothetical protein